MFTVFKDPDVDRVRYYLGIPLADTAEVVAAMQRVESVSQDAAKRVRAIMDELDAAEFEINSARPFSGQRFSKGVSWFENKRISDIKAEAKRVTENLAFILGLQIRRDIWGVSRNVTNRRIPYYTRS